METFAADVSFSGTSYAPDKRTAGAKAEFADQLFGKYFHVSWNIPWTSVDGG